MSIPQTSAQLLGNRTKCVNCLEVFSTESNYEAHRDGDYDQGRTCLLPQNISMKIVQTSTGSIWKSDKEFNWGSQNDKV